MYYLEAEYGKHDRLRNALLVALALHAAFILAVSFDAGTGSYQAPQIEVTLATRHSDASPEDARLMAQSNQEGSGDQAELDAVTSREKPLPYDIGTRQQLPPRVEEQTEASQNLLATRTPRDMAVNRQHREQEQDQQKPQLRGISPEVDRISQQLASLEAELDEQTRTYSSRPRVRRLTAASAKQAVDAAYLLDWRRRLEAVGNRYYPEASVRYGIYGDLRLLVVILQDGSLENIRVLSSSGYAVLDEAAIKIVRMAAPFAPFPPELAATTDKLEIIRTWQFQENELSSN
jgi:protein TonB